MNIKQNSNETLIRYFWFQMQFLCILTINRIIRHSRINSQEWRSRPSPRRSILFHTISDTFLEQWRHWSSSSRIIPIHILLLLCCQPKLNFYYSGVKATDVIFFFAAWVILTFREKDNQTLSARMFTQFSFLLPTNHMSINMSLSHVICSRGNGKVWLNFNTWIQIVTVLAIRF